MAATEMRTIATSLSDVLAAAEVDRPGPEASSTLASYRSWKMVRAHYAVVLRLRGRAWPAPPACSVIVAMRRSAVDGWELSLRALMAREARRLRRLERGPC